MSRHLIDRKAEFLPGVWEVYPTRLGCGGQGLSIFETLDIITCTRVLETEITEIKKIFTARKSPAMRYGSISIVFLIKAKVPVLFKTRAQKPIWSAILKIGRLVSSSFVLMVLGASFLIQSLLIIVSDRKVYIGFRY